MQRPSSSSGSRPGTGPAGRASSRSSAVAGMAERQRQMHLAAQTKQQWEDIRAFTEEVLATDAWRYEPAEYLPRPPDA